MLIGAVGLLAVAAVIMVVMLLKGERQEDREGRGRRARRDEDDEAGDRGRHGAATRRDTGSNAAKRAGDRQRRRGLGDEPAKTPEKHADQAATKPDEDAREGARRTTTHDAAHDDRTRRRARRVAKAETKAEPKTAPRRSDSGGCDEVSCVLNNYEGACCSKFKKKGGAAEAPSGGGGGGGKSDLPDGLDRAMISAGIANVKARVIACGDKSPAKGKVKVHVKVGGDGRVERRDASRRRRIRRSARASGGGAEGVVREDAERRLVQLSVRVLEALSSAARVAAGNSICRVRVARFPPLGVARVAHYIVSVREAAA